MEKINNKKMFNFFNKMKNRNKIERNKKINE